MGTSGAMDTSNGYVKYNITINQNSQSVGNNTSNVTVTVRFWRTNSGYSTYGSGTCYCKINGVTYSASVNTSQKITNSGIDLFSKTLDIGHNTDGTKTLTCSAWINLSTPLTSNEQYYSQQLSTIPRASQITLSTESITFGDYVTIYTHRASNNFLHNLYVDIGRGWERFASDVGDSYTWTVGYGWANETPNSATLSMRIWCETYNNGNYIGDSSASLLGLVPNDIVPTINNVAISETVSGIASKFGGYVETKSKLNFSVSASGSYNSTIREYYIGTNWQSSNSQSFTTDELKANGTLYADIVVKDSRGRQANSRVSYNVIGYFAPKINVFNAVRCNSQGVADDTGTYVLCTINGDIAGVTDRNDKSYIIKYKKRTDTSYTSIDITPQNGYQYIGTYIVPNINTDYEYEFVLEVSDYFSTTSSTALIPTGFTLMDYNASGRGMAIGKVSNQNYFEINMYSQFYDTVKIHTLDVGDELYNNSSGTSSSIQLSGSLVNYRWVEILYMSNDWKFSNMYVTCPQDKNVSLMSVTTSGGGGYIKLANIYMINDTITWTGLTEVYIVNGSNVGSYNADNIKIVMVRGYR